MTIIALIWALLAILLQLGGLATMLVAAGRMWRNANSLRQIEAVGAGYLLACIGEQLNIGWTLIYA